MACKWIVFASLLASLLEVDCEDQADLFEVQTWTYNATITWAPLFRMHRRHGSYLIEIAEQITQLIHGFVDSIRRSCLDPSNICPGSGICDRNILALTLDAGHNVFRHNMANITQLLADEKGLYTGAMAMLEAASTFEVVERCEDLVNSFAHPVGEECTGLIVETLNCARGFSEIARGSMALLHAEQIDAVASTHAGIGVNRPATAVFDTSNGFDRAQILVSLLQELRTLKANLHGTEAEVQVTAVEIGVNDGANSEAVLSKVPSLKLLLVDPYEFADQAFFEEYTEYAENMGVGMVDQLWKRMQPFRNRTVIICQKSAEAAHWVAPDSLDLVFVDGDHEYEAVWDDFRVWRPKLRAGGVLAGHDYSLFFPGTIRAVHEFALSTGVTLYLGPDSTYWFYF